jgi:hypothetical protein
MRTRTLVLALVAAGLAAAGCRPSASAGDAAEAAKEDTAGAGAMLEAPEPQPVDSIEITTTAGTVTLGLARDTVYMRLSDATLEMAARGLDTAEARSGGVGARIERMVKSSVRSMLRQRISYALADIEDVRYEDGAITFRYRDERTLSFEDVKSDDRPVLESFSPPDAARFVAAVRAAKGLP